MNAQEFVALWKCERGEMLRTFLSADSSSAVASQVRAMGLSNAQLEQLRGVFEGALTDVMYTLLLGLDGEASIGGLQQHYELRAEDGTVLTGQIEAEA